MELIRLHGHLLLVLLLTAHQLMLLGKVMAEILGFSLRIER
jgi:hypothetical protein